MATPLLPLGALARRTRLQQSPASDCRVGERACRPWLPWRAPASALALFWTGRPRFARAAP